MEMKQIKINPRKDLQFDYKVEEQCKSCKRYGKVATCPPHIRDGDYYGKLLPSYKSCNIYYKQFKIDNTENWKELGRKSSLILSKFLLQKRNQLVNEGHYFVVAFGAGSCKLCKECIIPCRFPDKSLIPLEATGLNIVKMMNNFGITIKHPVETYFYRVGAIFYD
jgi:predicted metal-binding protein